MNDETIERRGKIYRYDPDFDCYFAVPVKLSRWDRWGWLTVITLLTAIAYWAEFLR
jgi:hypothetical protein